MPEARAPSDRRATISNASRPAAERADAESASGSIDATRDPASDAARSGESNTASALQDVLLHVRVVDTARQPLTSGLLVGQWSGDPDQPSSPKTRDVHRFDAAIAGATTDVVLPARAESATLVASVPGQPPSDVVPVFRLHGTAQDGAASENERDVEIVVEGGVAAPRVRGRILVDGQLRVPRGLAIVAASSAKSRIHTVEARYEVGPILGLSEVLYVSSEETVPAVFPTGFDLSHKPTGGATVERDLELASGVTLRLSVTDLKSGAPLPGVELWITVGCFLEAGKGSSTRFVDHPLVAGADGVAIARGLSRSGGFSIRRDSKSRTRRVEMLPNPPTELPLPRESLLAESLDANTPDVIERTLRVDVDGRERCAFGVLDPSFVAPGEFGEGAAEVRFATLCGDVVFQQSRGAASPVPRPDPWVRSLASIAADAEGRWRFEIEADVDYRIWVEREHRRVSEIAKVRSVDGDVGPVALPPRTGTPILVRVLRCPTQGKLVLGVRDAGAVMPISTLYAASGGTFERRVQVDGRSSITVAGLDDRTRRQIVRTRVVDVDPATTSLVEVDLASDEARPIRVSCRSYIPKETTLKLTRVRPENVMEGYTALSVPLIDRESSEPVVVEPGRYVYFVDSIPRQGDLVAGVVDVARAPTGTPLEIRCEIEPHPRSELGAGFDVTEIAGVRPAPGRPSIVHVRFADEPYLAPFDPLGLPASARITLLQE